MLNFAESNEFLQVLRYANRLLLLTIYRVYFLYILHKIPIISSNSVISTKADKIHDCIENKKKSPMANIISALWNAHNKTSVSE